MRLPKFIQANILMAFVAVCLCGLVYAENRSAGWDYLDNKKYGEAESFFRQLIKSRPDNAQGYLGLGRVYLEKNDPEEALKWFNQALKINPNDSAIYENIGGAYENKSDYGRAVEFYKKAIELKPDNINLYYKISFIYKKENNFKDAIKWSKEAIRINPESGRGYTSLGLVYEDMGRFSEAIDCFKQAIKLDPSEDKSFIGIGNAYMRQGKYREAIEWYEKVKHADGFICAHEGLGLAYRKLGQPSLAEENFQTIVRTNLYNPLGYHDLADYYRHIGRINKAKENIEKALSLAVNKDDKRGVLETKGLILAFSGDAPSAEGIFKDLIREYGVNCPTLAGLGFVYNAKKDYKLARKYFIDALKQPDIVPADTSPINDRANIYLGLAQLNADEGNYREALKYYQQVLDEEPIAVFALLGIAGAYQKLGDQPQADIYYKRAQSVNPEHKR